MAIRPSAGTMRGVRAVRDPKGILLDSFDDPIIGKIGYVVVQGEGTPAVYDGENWHSVLNYSEDEWNNSVASLVAEQGQRIIQNAQGDPAYAQLAAQLVGGASTNPSSFGSPEPAAPAASAAPAEEPITYYGS